MVMVVVELVPVIFFHFSREIKGIFGIPAFIIITIIIITIVALRSQIKRQRLGYKNICI
ncbi:hypothetical protein Hanom_Chr11g00985491 [Helianthus anomalus]